MMKELDRIDEIMTDYGFSGVVKITAEDQWIYERAAGYRDRVNEVDNDLATRFAIASGTKFLTALAIGRLIDKGLLSLETKALELIDYDFGDYDSEITIEHLLTHSSGIPDYYDEDQIEDFDNFKVAIPWNELKEPKDYFPIFPKEAMVFKAGTKFKYNNSGYVLLAAIVAQVGKMPYVDFVEREIFDKAGMSYTGFYPLNQLPKNTAIGYIDDEEGYRSNVYNLPIVGAGDGGAFSCTKDMEKLWNAFIKGELLSETLTAQFMTPQIQEDFKNDKSWYGYGLWLTVEEDQVSEAMIVGCDAGISFKSGYKFKDHVSYSVFSNTADGAWIITGAIKEMVF